MKQYPWKFKLCREGIEWWQSDKTLGSDHYFYYFKVGIMDKEMRDAWSEKPYGQCTFGTSLLGLHKFWHDCPHAQLNLYYFVIYWSSPWTNMPKDYWK